MATYTIGEISKMFQLPLSTLRYYEEIGILTNIERTPSGQRIFTDAHVNRLKTICCFKNTGMTMNQLQTFFSYESKETEHIEDILELLQEQKDSIVLQISQLKKDYAHLLKKLHYYGDIKECMDTGKPLPEWKDYRNKDFTEE